MCCEPAVLRAIGSSGRRVSSRPCSFRNDSFTVRSDPASGRVGTGNEARLHHRKGPGRRAEKGVHATDHPQADGGIRRGRTRRRRVCIPGAGRPRRTATATSGAAGDDDDHRPDQRLRGRRHLLPAVRAGLRRRDRRRARRSTSTCPTGRAGRRPDGRATASTRASTTTRATSSSPAPTRRRRLRDHPGADQLPRRPADRPDRPRWTRTHFGPMDAAPATRASDSLVTLVYNVQDENYYDCAEDYLHRRLLRARVHRRAWA